MAADGSGVYGSKKKTQKMQMMVAGAYGGRWWLVFMVTLSYLFKK